MLSSEKFASRQKAKEGTVPLPFSGNRAEYCSHNLGKALREGLGLLKTGLSSYTVKFSYVKIRALSLKIRAQGVGGIKK